MAKYEFNEAKHIHTLDGKPLTGTTTVLGVIAKPALIPWAAKMAVEYVREHWDEEEVYTRENIDKILEEAKTAHSKRKDKAGAWGTQLHSDVEGIIKDAINHNNGKAMTYPKGLPTDNFIDWAEKNNVKFLASEKSVYSERIWTGGICDFICEIDGKRWVGDIKTSGSGIYPENFWQTAAYDMMLQDMGEPPAEGYIILNIKENGEFNEKRNISIEDNQQAFMSCLNIYRTLEKIKSNL